LEIPAAIRFSLGGGWDGYVALGCVIRGETSHYDLVCEECARGVQTLVIDRGLAVGFGVLTVENEDQAWVRARPAEMDKGGEAARACLEMIALRRRLAAP
jgi:6,7-dimethyl-8-ribityllumazine synthase